LIGEPAKERAQVSMGSGVPNWKACRGHGSHPQFRAGLKGRRDRRAQIRADLPKLAERSNAPGENFFAISTTRWARPYVAGSPSP